jgi:nucleoside-diphosphate-sugar epimerase
MSQVLVTGAGGYIGSILVPILLQKGFKVRALDRYFFGKDTIPNHDNIEIVYEDIRKIEQKYFENIDFVIDLAAMSNDPSGDFFQDATWEINHIARVKVAELAKKNGVKRYILPSSCSIYGFQDEGVIADENSSTNPLTTYAKANLKAEEGVFALSDSNFCVTALRQATVYGYSPRMRFDLAINGMTYGAWSEKVLPLMRDGNQWRPMVHVKDTANAMCFMLEQPFSDINCQIFNVGSDENNYQLGDLAVKVVNTLPGDIPIEWYGDPDHRSYRVSFKKIKSLGFETEYMAEDGVLEIYEALDKGLLKKTTESITIEWYQELVKWHKKIKEIEMYGGIIDL